MTATSRCHAHSIEPGNLFDRFDPVRRGACVGFCLRGDKWATLSARQRFSLLAWNAGPLVWADR